MANDWHSEDVEVEILSSHENAEYRGKICVIKTVSGPTCSVWIISADQTISVGCEDLKPVQPQKNHKVSSLSLITVVTFFFQVKVLHGDDIGQTGELISIDGNDGIVRMDQDKQLKILQLKFLGKIHQ